jgi:rod shape-determining protein MreD
VKFRTPAHGGQRVGPKLVPVTVTVLLAVLSAVPLDIPDYAVVTPNFVLMSLFHWTLYRPEHLSYLAVFLIGLFFDLLTTAPGATIGITPLVLLVARWSVLSSRKFYVGRSFPFVWSGFALVTAGANLAVWALGSLVTASLFDPRRFAFQAVLTVALFPAADWLFARLQRATEALA